MEEATLARLGYDEALADWLDGLGLAGAVAGRVARVDRGACLVFTAAGSERSPGVPGLVTGDWVALSGDVIAAVAPRRSAVTRADPSGAGEQVLAANVDSVFIVHGLDRPLRPGRLERGFVLAWETGADPVLVLAKADLVADPAAAAAEAAALAPGVPVHLTSAFTGLGLDGLLSELDGSHHGDTPGPGRTAALLGESGAGKSTLVNALVGAEVMPTAAVRSGDAKGRHTTTARHLVPLPDGGVLVDTPGLRQLGLWSGEAGLSATFADVEELAAACRFSDCAHGGEPGCAVAEALADGRLSPRRLAGYDKLQKELEHAEGRRAEHEKRAEDRRFGRMYKQIMEEKRGRRR
jgi:ribosome biogenesis GTPase / thiamine phosphate phosphatase